MSYSGAAAAVAIGLTLLNLLLTLGVIRRLREHTDLLSRRVVDNPAEAKVMLDPGQEPAGFVVTAQDGGVIDSAMLAQRSLVAFLSPGCDLCHEQLPEFIGYAGHFSNGRDATVAVVVGDHEQAHELVSRLTPVAKVVLEDKDGAMCKAFDVKGYPAYAVVDGGVIVASGYRMDSLPAPSL